ncbi:MAG: beta-N-acetylhexosaminidase [Bdellovibrionales bacterium]|nr:beta-N-acetylhexosaminidase [Bdellovibrionales bacterium]
MSDRRQIGQLYIIGLQGPELLAEESKFIIENNIGGVILFDRNIVSPQQLHKLCSDIQSLRTKMPDRAPLFISIDMEGGRVQRLKAPFTQWPPLGSFEELDSTSLAFKMTQAMGQELKAVGINLDFAPCIDVLTNPENKVIGDRSAGKDPEHVGKMASALVRGYIKSGVLSCVKHYPGHGNTLLDSHEELPIEDTDLNTLQERELVPFKKAFRARAEMVMTAHIKFPKVDPDWPVTLSEKFIKNILRKDLRFSKIVITDDLDMRALRNHYSIEEIPVRALEADCDMLLYCNEFDVPPQSIEAVEKAIANGRLNSDSINSKYQSVLSLKKRALKDPDPLPFAEAAKIIAHPEHLKIAKAVFNKEIPEDI